MSGDRHSFAIFLKYLIANVGQLTSSQAIPRLNT